MNSNVRIFVYMKKKKNWIFFLRFEIQHDTCNVIFSENETLHFERCEQTVAANALIEHSNSFTLQPLIISQTTGANLCSLATRRSSSRNRLHVILHRVTQLANERILSLGELSTIETRLRMHLPRRLENAKLRQFCRQEQEVTLHDPVLVLAERHTRSKLATVSPATRLCSLARVHAAPVIAIIILDQWPAISNRL